MIYTDKTKKAMEIMVRQHKNKTDKSGLPYILHPWLVAEHQIDEVRTIVALLHDVVEDTNMTLEDIKNEGFSDEVVEAIRLLTHNPDEEYLDYINNISNNEIALDVKLEDLKHNSQITRLNNITDIDIERAERYKKYLEYLENKKIEKNKRTIK